MDTEDPEPSWVKKLLYLSGIRAPVEHKNWLVGIVQNAHSRRKGFLLAIPNVVVVLAFALVSLALGDTRYAIFLVCLAPALALAGAFVAPISRRRSRWLAKRNGLPR